MTAVFIFISVIFVVFIVVSVFVFVFVVFVIVFIVVVVVVVVVFISHMEYERTGGSHLMSCLFSKVFSIKHYLRGEQWGNGGVEECRNDRERKKCQGGV